MSAPVPAAPAGKAWTLFVAALLLVVLGSCQVAFCQVAVTPTPPHIAVDLSSLEPPDSDSPTVTVVFKVKVEGSPADLFSLSVTPQQGLEVQGYQVEPSQGTLPIQDAQVTLNVARYSEVGSKTVTITASSNTASGQGQVVLELSRRKISISLTKPKAGESTKPGNWSIAGRVDPPVGGVVVHVDLYHKYPELKTDEQIGGYKSGIRYSGSTATLPDGTFEIGPSDVALERMMAPYALNQVEERVWYLHFYTQGFKLYGEDLQAFDPRKPYETMRTGVLTFDADYAGVPKVKGGDVPESNVAEAGEAAQTAQPDWAKNLPLIPTLIKTFFSNVPSALAPFVPFIALAILVLIVLAIVVVAVKVVQKVT